MEEIFSLKIDKSKLSSKYYIWERPASLFYISFPSESVVLPIKKYLGVHWGRTLGFFKNGMVKMIFQLDKTTVSGIQIINQFMSKDVLNKNLKIIAALEDKIKSHFNKSIKTLSDKKLNLEFQNFYKVYLDYWGITHLSELVGFASESLLSDLLSQEELALLTTPLEKSFSLKEEEDILKILEKVQKDPSLKLDNKKILKLLKDHCEKYYWVQNNYLTIKRLAPDYFQTQIMDLLKEKVSATKRLESINSHIKKTKENQTRIISEKNLTIAQKKLIQISQQMIILQDDRKALNLEANVYLLEILKELSSRTHIPLNLLLWSTSKEFSKLIAGEDLTNEFTQRKKSCVLIVDEDEFLVKTKDQYGKLYQEYFGDIKNQNRTELGGRRAQGGRITGKAKIILNPHEANNFQKGDVLVTTMTSPDFISLMKKASAIVTDQGGITCHAAIISRELQIPCVVGTQFATQTFKDGDILEVNANHGLVKILK